MTIRAIVQVSNKSRRQTVEPYLKELLASGIMMIVGRMMVVGISSLVYLFEKL